MPKKIKPNMQSAELGNFLSIVASERGLSLRAMAAGADISHTYLSEIISGKKIPEAGVCNALADFLEIPRLKFYRLAGWLDSEFVERLEEITNQDPELKEVLNSIISADDKNRAQLIELIRAGVRK